ncbi:MAG: histidine phosphatase family protein [Rhodoferax sp.]|nr:histidine phosphatase family protein [Rhodoferax sp.]
MTLWVVRHAQPLIAPGTCYGALDVAADAAATQRAARALAEAVPHGATLRCSTLQRCELLAQYLSGLRPDLTTISEPRLVEMNFGRWEGVAWADIPKAALDAWTTDFWRHCFGEAESLAELMDRVRGVWDEDRAQKVNVNGSRCAIWITHAGVARAALLLSRGVGVVDQADQWPLEAPGFGAWWQLEP